MTQPDRSVIPTQTRTEEERAAVFPVVVLFVFETMPLMGGK